MAWVSEVEINGVKYVMASEAEERARVLMTLLQEVRPVVGPNAMDTWADLMDHKINAAIALMPQGGTNDSGSTGDINAGRIDTRACDVGKDNVEVAPQGEDDNE